MKKYIFGNDKLLLHDGFQKMDCLTKNFCIDLSCQSNFRQKSHSKSRTRNNFVRN